MSRATARTATLVNLFVTPGMGSMMAGRFLAGLGQLAIAATGVGVFAVWFVKIMAESYRMYSGEESSIQMHPLLGFMGLLVFGLGWLWALATSIGLMKEARRNESAQTKPYEQSQGGAGLS